MLRGGKWTGKESDSLFMRIHRQHDSNAEGGAGTDKTRAHDRFPSGFPHDWSFPCRRDELVCQITRLPLINVRSHETYECGYTRYTRVIECVE